MLLAVGCHPHFRVWRNNVGVASFPGGAKVAYGLCVGSGDLIGILQMPDGTGRFTSLECKSDAGKLTEEQVKWADVVRRFGGFACTVRSGTEALDALARARAGESQ